MFKARFQTSEDDRVEDTFEKNFDSEDDIYAYMREQNEHPFMKITLLSHWEIDAMKGPDGQELNAYQQEDVERAMADRDYWKEMAPKGYSLIGFNYRYDALFSVDGSRASVNVTDEHIRFFKGEE